MNVRDDITFDEILGEELSEHFNSAPKRRREAVRLLALLKRDGLWRPAYDGAEERVLAWSMSVFCERQTVDIRALIRMGIEHAQRLGKVAAGKARAASAARDGGRFSKKVLARKKRGKSPQKRQRATDSPQEP